MQSDALVGESAYQKYTLTIQLSHDFQKWKVSNNNANLYI